MSQTFKASAILATKSFRNKTIHMPFFSKNLSGKLLLNRRAFFSLLCFLFVVCFFHVLYFMKSTVPPSADEAHYISGAYAIAQGIRTGTLNGAWQGYLSALGFKAPLICVPAALFMLCMNGDIFPSMLSGVFILFLLGIAAYSLFCNCLPAAQAAVGAALLTTMPLVTGLTHKFYTENLVLLLVIVYLDLLVRRGWSDIKWSAILGLVLGLGVLTKFTFPALLVLSSFYILCVSIWRIAHSPGYKGNLVRLVTRIAVMLVVAFIIAWPWYSYHWQEVLTHSKAALNCQDCAYPTFGSFLVNISSGPYFFIFCLALIGVVPAWRILRSSETTERARLTWIVLLLVALTILVSTISSINKAVRLSEPWLPLIAILAVIAPMKLLTSSRLAYPVLLSIAGLSFILFLHNSFEIIPLKPLRLGDLRIFDSRYPLNIPNWFDDNHPLDHRDYRVFGQATEFIAGDARQHFSSKPSYMVRLTESGLLISHDCFSLFAGLRGYPVNFVWWPGTVTSGPDAPEYIVHFKNFKQFYAGDYFIEYYPPIEKDVSEGKLFYKLIKELPGPDNSAVQVFRKNF